MKNESGRYPNRWEQAKSIPEGDTGIYLFKVHIPEPEMFNLMAS